MLKNITINNFAIIDNLELDFNTGMTVLTGETGAGKSIIIDALQYALGSRADSSMVRHGCNRADISVNFDIQQINNAQEWLQQNEFDAEQQCLLRRTINADGGSKQFINGQACTQPQMRDLATLLVNIHGQHENQLLGKKTKQQQLLDDFAQSLSLVTQKNQTKALDKFAQHAKLLTEVQNHYQQWAIIQAEIASLQGKEDQSAKIDLLNFQIQELEKLAVEKNEAAKLEQEYKLLSRADNLLTDCNQAKTLLDGDNDANALTLLQTSVQHLQPFQELDPAIANSVKTLSEALINVQEACHELENYLEKVEVNPARLQQVETRLNSLHDAARKYKVTPEQLPTKLLQLQQELDNLQHADKRLAALQQELQIVETQYQQAAKKLSTSRHQAAERFNQQVTANIQQLGMPGGHFQASLTAREQLSPNGNEQIEFLVSANPGQPLKPINKVASGGELSRISLAIEVITAQNTNTPTLIFDEVDVGIGGGTAEIVGRLLRRLGNKTQVLCITHLPQVAAQAHHHLKVSKLMDKQQTQTQITLLSAEEKIHEIARMLGGVKITKQTLAHAAELLSEVEN